LVVALVTGSWLAGCGSPAEIHGSRNTTDAAGWSLHDGSLDSSEGSTASSDGSVDSNGGPEGGGDSNKTDAEAGGDGEASVESMDGGDLATGNPKGTCNVPTAGQAADVSSPTTVVGQGTPASCTPTDVVAAVQGGGVVTFDCGPDAVTIVVPEILIYNDGGVTKDGSVTIDGGGKITLSGGGTHRILHQDTCDSTLHYTSPYCNNQDTPHLVLQNIAFTGGGGVADENGLLGGGAIYVGGGTFKAVNVLITSSAQTNAAGTNVQDLAGGAIYTINMYNQATANSMFTTPATPTYVVNSTFRDDTGINGGALGSIGTSWSIYNSLFSGNSATGHGENPAAAGTYGGGLGGAIYNDGDSYTLTVCGSDFENNTANELGSGSIFQVVDDLKGALVIDACTFHGNSDTGDVQTGAAHPGIFVEAQSASDGTSGVTITSSTFE
jgi:hypothetical protein